MINSIRTAVEEAVTLAQTALRDVPQKADFADWADWLDDLLGSPDPDPGKNQKGWDKAFKLPEHKPHTS